VKADREERKKEGWRRRVEEAAARAESVGTD
jgi:hypothetical protein